jgi:hypothetical protein
MRSLPLVLNCAVARWLALIVLIDPSGSALAAQNAPGAPPAPDAQNCAALTALNLEAARGGPAIITSARLVEVPVGGLQPPFFHPSGYASGAAQVASKIKQYCDVTGYVAPQNKFELKLPLPVAGELLFHPGHMACNIVTWLPQRLRWARRSFR